jgi:hypothetical protein
LDLSGNRRFWSYGWHAHISGGSDYFVAQANKNPGISPASTTTPEITSDNLGSVEVTGTGQIGDAISVVIVDASGNSTDPATTTVGADGTWSVQSIDASRLDDGPVTYFDSATDSGGNVTTITRAATKQTAPIVTGPIVTAVSPLSGATSGGTTVTITGSHLGTASTATVDFGTNNPAVIVSDTGGTIVVRSPVGTAGTVDVTVTVAGTASSINRPADQFTYQATPTPTPTPTSTTTPTPTSTTTPTPIPTQTQVTGEKPIFQQKHNKKGKPVGKPVLSGFTLDFGVALSQAAANNSDNYQIDTITIKKVKRKPVQVLTPIKNFTVSYLPASDAFQITFGSNETFSTGGQITIESGLTTATGGTLSGSAVFTISKGGKSVVPS